MNIVKLTVAWCREHDWGRNALYVNGEITGLVDCYSAEGVTVEETISWPVASLSDVRALREWAGY